MSMKASSELFDRLRSLDCREVAELVGLDVTHSGQCRCPAHEDKHPSAHVYPDGLHCFSCALHLDAVGIVQTVKGGATWEAACWLAEQYQIPIRNKPHRSKVNAKPKPNRAEIIRTVTGWQSAVFKALLLEKRKCSAILRMYKHGDENTLFFDTLQRRTKIEYYLEILTKPTKTELLEIYTKERETVERLYRASQ